MDFPIPHDAQTTKLPEPKCPHQSEGLQNNYLQQDPIRRLYIKALKAIFDRMLHLLIDQSGDPLFSVRALFYSENIEVLIFWR